MALLVVVAGLAVATRPVAPPDREGFALLLPRGMIGGLVDPEFVPAAEAHLPGDAWVLGFAHQGEAYAYALSLLNINEVVNHTVRGAPIAAVW